MKMKKLIILFLSQFIFAYAISQTKIDTIPFFRTASGLMHVNVKINNYSKIFIFDTGASGIVINSATFNDMKRKSFISSADITGSAQVIIANGSAATAKIINLKSVIIGGFKIKNTEAFIMPDANAPLLVGQSVFSKFGKITIDYANNEILLTESKTPQNNSALQLKELKFIPCSRTKIADVQTLINTIGKQIKILSVTEEQNVPPPIKAVDKIKTGITIRYFDNKDYAVAKFIKQKLLTKQKYKNQSINIENMLPFFRYKSIPGLIEIWIK